MRAAGSPLLAAAVVLAVAAIPSPARAQKAVGPPSIDAPQAILVEPFTGEGLLAHHSRESRPVASTTKLMTALLVLERTSPDDVFTASAYRPVSSAETRVGLRPAFFKVSTIV